MIHDLNRTGFASRVSGRSVPARLFYDLWMNTEAVAPTVTMYWRPGCGFCAALQRNLDQRGVAYLKKNIWEDPAAAEFVRSVARGNETVPTVTVGDISIVNPSADEVEQAMVGA
jgi:glutaredoxin-like protein